MIGDLRLAWTTYSLPPREQEEEEEEEEGDPVYWRDC